MDTKNGGENEQILDSYIQSQASQLIQMSLQTRFCLYLAATMVNKILENKPDGVTIKRALLDVWHDTELENCEQQTRMIQESLRRQGIVPMSDEQMAGPFIEILRSLYKEFSERLELDQNHQDHIEGNSGVGVDG